MKMRKEPEKIRLWDLGTQVLTPSKQSPWRWSLARGAKFTEPQICYLQVAELDPETVETVEVISRATAREMWVPMGDPMPDVVITCPLIQRLASGRLKVVAPNGRVETVGADGRVLPPRFGWAA